MFDITSLFIDSLSKVWVTFTHNWPYLLLSVLISVSLKLTIQPDKVTAFLTRYRRVGIVGATAAAVATPFCSCGTTAVILGMVASTVPWAPVVAFMVASPLTSPEGLVYSAGLFGWPFAITYFASSIVLGLLGGLLAEFFEARGWLANQARFAGPAGQPAHTAQPVLQPALTPACACAAPAGAAQTAAFARDIRVKRPVMAAAPAAALAISAPACECSPAPAAQSVCGCGAAAAQPGAAKAGSAGKSQAQPAARASLKQWAAEIYATGRQLLFMFLGFAFIGYVLNGLIPPAWISAVFGSGNVYSVPLAATLGIPLYINSEGSLPLVRALIEGGMSQGAALAFLITGSGTSLGAIAGALTIARWRVIGLVVGTLWAGSIALGFAFDLMLAAHLF